MVWFVYSPWLVQPTAFDSSGHRIQKEQDMCSGVGSLSISYHSLNHHKQRHHITHRGSANVQWSFAAGLFTRQSKYQPTNQRWKRPSYWHQNGANQCRMIWILAGNFAQGGHLLYFYSVMREYYLHKCTINTDQIYSKLLPFSPTTSPNYAPIQWLK